MHQRSPGESLSMLSVYRNSFDTTGVTASLDAVLMRIKTGARGLDEKTRYCNATAETDPVAYKRYKESNLPAVTFSGTFPRGKRKAAHLATHSGLVTLDIDGLTTDQIPDVLSELAQMPHIVLAFVSPSGAGIKAILRVNPIPQNDTEHKGAYQACLDYIETLAEEYGFEIDTSGKDCSRLCYLAHDPLVIVHTDAPPIDWDADAWFEAERQREERAEKKSVSAGDFPADIEALAYIPRDVEYEDWRNIGMAIKAAGLPLSVWRDWNHGQRLSSSSGWINEDLNRYWDSFKRTGITWGTVVHLAEQHGYTPPRRSTAKLERTYDAPIEPTETLDTNRETREHATDTFLTAETETDTLHMLLVKDATGTGKTHTTLSKAQQHGKRTLAQLPHTELATQAVEIAFEHGYKNPCHLLGREHNWEASGIAEIPVEERTRDLFERNNCIMADEVKAYTEKRLAPRTYCEHRCEFRDGCPHLAQYEGLGHRDFVATCTPNLLFDPNLRGYLHSIVTATDEPTAEDLAIDAMLGTRSEETTAFDFAIVDDYGINGLYTDVTLDASEFQQLKNAWQGTPTADFATRVLKAFGKKKPHAIAKALRKALEATAEHRTEIAETLTQHARHGKVEITEPPKGSKETQRLLSEKHVKYTDGGTQQIPVDIHAYLELKKKAVPCVHPDHLQSVSPEHAPNAEAYRDTKRPGEPVRVPHTPTHALIAGVPIDALTPVWQKGATPIELIEIFLASIGNDTNAPIQRMFRPAPTPSETPIATLTFSIPPQAPVGVLPHIAMLSATTPPEDTQRAFDRQPVTFSEHTGNRIAFAENVNVYQYTDARLTSASVFEYPKDAEGKRKLQEAPIGLLPTAEKRLTKLNDWARSADGKTAFISYKEFTTQFQETLNGFDIVTHFDTIAGLNLDGLKYLVVFGYPKVKHEIVTEHARKQHTADTDPLPKADPNLKDEETDKPIPEYIQMTEEATYTDNGITITERRYTDPRLEKIRHQLATEKIEQAVGRARLHVWTDTTTLLITDAPVPGITDRATLFSTAAFNLAETPDTLADAMERIQHARDTGDVHAVMETHGLKKSQAYAITQATRTQKKADRDAEILRLHNDQHSYREIERLMKESGYTQVSLGTINSVITASRNSNREYCTKNYQSETLNAPTNPAVTDTETQPEPAKTDCNLRKTAENVPHREPAEHPQPPRQTQLPHKRE